MLIECSYCEAKVDGKVIANHIDPEDPEYGYIYRTFLLECPNCRNSIVGGQVGNVNYAEDGERHEWGRVSRLWPNPEESLSHHIPEIVRASLEEADLCFKAKAYAACAVMCGRALEAICRHHLTKSQYLAGGLKELRERGIIDGRLAQWADELHKSRNMGAHASGEKVSNQDARDLLDFTNAICEYMFVLTAQYESFMKRQEARTKEKISPKDGRT